MINHSITIKSSTDNGNPLSIDMLGVKKAALILRAINHKLRQQIIKLIDEKGKTTVTDLYVSLRIEQSVASQHLSILRKAGFVSTTRDGKFVYYTINGTRFKEVQHFVQQLIR